ncbi:4496_t:CDS:2, partial [Funneliformis geosporum]
NKRKEAPSDIATNAPKIRKSFTAGLSNVGKNETRSGYHHTKRI